jgi:hypothetical protein
VRVSPRRSWGIVVLGVFGVIITLMAALWGYAYWANSLPPFRPRLPPMPSPNGYERALALAARLPRPPQGTDWPYGAPTAIRPFMDAARPSLDQIRATFRLEWRAPPVLSSSYEFTDMAASRECARYFVVESRLAQAGGDADEAMQRALDAVELGVRLPRGGTVLHALVAVALHAIGLSNAEGLVPGLSSRGTVRALERVRRLRTMLPAFTEILEGDRISTLASLTDSFSPRGWQTPIQALRGSWQQFQIPGETDWSVTKEVLAFWLTPKQRAFRNLDLYYSRLIAESKKPFRARQPVPVPTDLVSQLNAGVSETAEAQWSRVAAELALLEVALAAREHQLQQGRLPNRLNQISRRWHSEAPQDPWGQAIRYRVSSGKPVVYSLGPDGKDDGASASNPRDTIIAGDLVFGSLYDRRWNRRR